MTIREEYVLEIARLSYAQAIGIAELPAFIDEQFVQHYNSAGREYYLALNQRQLARLCNDVWRRAEVLRSGDAAKLGMLIMELPEVQENKAMSPLVFEVLGVLMKRIDATFDENAWGVSERLTVIEREGGH